MQIPFQLTDQEGNLAGPELWEHTTYVLKFELALTAEQHAAIHQNYRAIMRRSYRSTYTVRFENHVGAVSLFGKTFRIQSKKWDEEQLDCLWREVSRQAATLPYYQFAVARQAAERTPEEQEAIRYQQWVYLRHELLEREELRTAWESVAREPHSLLSTEQQQKEPWLASKADDRTWLHMISSGNLTELTSTDHPLAKTSVSRQLAIRTGSPLYPTELTETHKYMSYDTRENRFIKHALHEFLEVIVWMSGYLAKKKQTQSIHRLDELERENQNLHKQLHSMLSLYWMAEVGRLQGSFGNSTVLQRRQGYRQWFVFYQRWIQGIRYPMDQNRLAELVEAKNVATVYEYWCFFEVLKAVEEVIGHPRERLKVKREVDEFQRLGNGLEMIYNWQGEPLTVCFNKQFSKKDGPVYSGLVLRPDISLRWRGAWYHFDAKFKKGLIREDLQKMHVYKDAISGSRSSVALYPAPNKQARQYLFESGTAEEKAPWEGVGGMDLHVGGDNQPLVELVRNLLEREDVRVNDSTVFSRR